MRLKGANTHSHLYQHVLHSVCSWSDLPFQISLRRCNILTYTVLVRCRNKQVVKEMKCRNTNALYVTRPDRNHSVSMSPFPASSSKLNYQTFLSSSDSVCCGHSSEISRGFLFYVVVFFCHFERYVKHTLLQRRLELVNVVFEILWWCSKVYKEIYRQEET